MVESGELYVDTMQHIHMLIVLKLLNKVLLVRGESYCSELCNGTCTNTKELKRRSCPVTAKL